MRCASCGSEYADDLDGCPDCAKRAELTASINTMSALVAGCGITAIAAPYLGIPLWISGVALVLAAFFALAMFSGMSTRGKLDAKKPPTDRSQ